MKPFHVSLTVSPFIGLIIKLILCIGNGTVEVEFQLPGYLWSLWKIPGSPTFLGNIILNSILEGSFMLIPLFDFYYAIWNCSINICKCIEIHDLQSLEKKLFYTGTVRSKDQLHFLKPPNFWRYQSCLLQVFPLCSVCWHKYWGTPGTLNGGNFIVSLGYVQRKANFLTVVKGTEYADILV